MFLFVRPSEIRNRIAVIYLRLRLKVVPSSFFRTFIFQLRAGPRPETYHGSASIKRRSAAYSMY